MALGTQETRGEANRKMGGTDLGLDEAEADVASKSPLEVGAASSYADVASASSQCGMGLGSGGGGVAHLVRDPACAWLDCGLA